MRILFLTSLFPNSKHMSEGIFNLSRAKALRKLGYELKVVAPVSLTPPERFFFPSPKITKIVEHIQGQKAILFKEEIEGFEVFHPKWLWLPRRYFWKYEVHLLHFFVGRKIRQTIKQFRPDAVITSWIQPFGAYAKYIKEYYNIPILAIAEGDDILIYPYNYPGWKSIEGTLNRYCNKVIFVSDRMSEIVNNKLNIISSTVIKNGFETNLFYLGNRHNKNDDIKLLSIGYFGYVKGHDILLQALTELGNKCHLTLVGDGVLRKQYEEFARDNNLRVRFAGHVSHKSIKTYLDNCNLLCMPSRSEGLPVAPLEAMACGVPVVAAKVGGLSEMVIDGFNGYLCEPESSGALAECIKKALNTEWNYSEIAGWTKYNYSWDTWANQILNVIGKEICAVSAG